MAKYPNIPAAVVRRLPRYYRFLKELAENGTQRISSSNFAEITGLSASQIRQDLNCFGGFGHQGYGYNVTTLCDEISKILYMDKSRPAILLGAGNLGIAITRYMNFTERGFQLLGIFDNNPLVAGKTVCDWTVMDISLLENFCAINSPQAAFLCVPKTAAAGLADRLFSCGIRAFWNFSHYDLSFTFGDDVVVENVHLSDSLRTLSFYAGELLEKN